MTSPFPLKKGTVMLSIHFSGDNFFSFKTSLKTNQSIFIYFYFIYFLFFYFFIKDQSIFIHGFPAMANISEATSEGPAVFLLFMQRSANVFSSADTSFTSPCTDGFFQDVRVFYPSISSAGSTITLLLLSLMKLDPCPSVLSFLLC